MKKKHTLSQQRGNNSTDLLFYNRRLILKLIRKHSVISRIELAELSGLKPATITIIINEFIEKNLVEDCGLIEGKNGRRVKGVRLVDSNYCTISVRITSSYFAIGIFDINLSCIAVEKKKYKSYDNFYQTLVDINNKIEEFSILANDYEILGISLGLQNDFFMDYSSDATFCIFGPDSRIDIAAFFKASCPYPVYIERVVDFTAYHVYTKDYIHNINEKIVLTLDFSTSVDLSILHHGSLYHGAYSSAHCFSEIYVHDSENTLKNIEEVLSIDAIMQHAINLLPDYPGSSLQDLSEFTYRNLINAYSNKDPLALVVYDHIADMLAQFLIILMKLFSPHSILIGDEIPPEAAFLKTVTSYLTKYDTFSLYSKTEIVNITGRRSTQLDAVLLGGSSLVIDNELPKHIL